MARIALAVTVAALTFAALASAAQAKGPQATVFKVARGEGVIRLTFAGNDAAGCRERGVCGVSGTTTYAFGGAPRGGFVYMLRNRGRTRFVQGYFTSTGQTVADVGTAGAAERCVDRVPHREERVYFKPGRNRLEFYWRSIFDPAEEGEDFPEELLPLLEDYQADPFATRCSGPALRELFESEALPEAEVPYRVFRTPRRGSFRTKDSRPFAGGGFAGTVEWDLRYAFERRRHRDGSFIVG